MNQMQTPDLVTTTLDQGVLTLTLGAGKAHPLSLAMIRALHAALDAAAKNPDARVLVIHGPGHIFCAGHDLKEIARHSHDADNGAAFLRELFEACGEMMQAVHFHPLPTIAMVEGIATAAGLQLVAACDLAFASQNATFCLPGVKNGGFCTTPAVAVSRAVGRKHLMQLALSGAPQSADWALRAGLINELTAPEDLAAHTYDFARTLATRNPGAITEGKRAIYTHLDMPLVDAYPMATEVMIGHFMDPTRHDYDTDTRWSK